MILLFYLPLEINEHCPTRVKYDVPMRLCACGTLIRKRGAKSIKLNNATTIPTYSAMNNILNRYIKALDDGNNTITVVQHGIRLAVGRCRLFM